MSTIGVNNTYNIIQCIIDKITILFNNTYNIIQ